MKEGGEPFIIISITLLLWMFIVSWIQEYAIKRIETKKKKKRRS